MSSKLKYIFPLLVIVIFTFSLYSHTLKYDFSNFDDGIHLTSNKAVRSLRPQNIKEIFTQANKSYGSYAPLFDLSFALEYHFFGYDPFIYKLDNLLLHIAVCLLIYFFSLQLGLSILAAGIAALLFAIHPIHIESVVWITERKDVLYSFFYMLALYQYQLYLKKYRFIHYLTTFFFGILSMLSKPMAMSLPLILLLCDWQKGRKINRTALLEKIPFLLTIIPILLMIYFSTSNPIRVPSADYWEGFLTGVWSLTFYIQKFFYPLLLNPLYELPKPIAFSNPHYMTPLILLFVLVGIFIVGRKQRWLIFAGLYFLFSIFFLIKFDEGDVLIVADHYMYLPSLGACVLIGFIVESFYLKWKNHPVKRRAILIFSIIILTGLSFKTIQQTLIWRDNIALWSYVIEHSPNREIAYNNRGTSYANKGLYDLGLKDYNKGLNVASNNAKSYVQTVIQKEIDKRGPLDTTDQSIFKKYIQDRKFSLTARNIVDLLTNRGRVHVLKKEYDLALADYNLVLTLDPESQKGYYNRGKLFAEQERYDLALLEFKKAIFNDPHHAKAYDAKASAHVERGDFPFAMQDFSKALEIDPLYRKAYNNRGVLYIFQKQFPLALIDFNKALILDPQYALSYSNRGYALQELDQDELALNDYNKALEIDPHLADAYDNRGTWYTKKGQYDLALLDFNMALELKPNYDVVYYNRSKAYRAMEKWDEALKDALKSQDLGYSVERSYLKDLSKR